MTREDSREYYSLVQLPEDIFRIIVENVQNYVLNHATKLGNLTLEDFWGTDKLETLTLKNALYVIVLRYFNNLGELKKNVFLGLLR